MKVKILPITILTCTIFLAGKTMDIMGVSFVGTSAAAATAEQPKTDAKADATPAAATPAAAPTDVASADAAKPADTTKAADSATPAATPDAAAPAADAAKTDDKSAAADSKDSKDGDKKDGDKKDAKPTNISTVRPEEQIPQFTTSEKDVLEKLAARRTELDAWSKDLEMKESLIDASSKKLDEKIAQLKQLKTDTEALLKTYNEHEDAKIRSLVKIYENMKPKDAAAIFGQMDMDIMLEIVDKMSERKASAILANMDPKKAKELTQKIADQKTLKTQQQAEQPQPKA